MNANTVVSLKNVSIYQQKQLILREVQLNMTKGEFAYLIGKTGSGKSTLLKSLYGALPIREGKGMVADFDLRKLNRKTIPLLRRKLGIIFQDFNLLSDRSVYENMRFVLKATAWKGKAAIDRRIDEVLAKVGMEGKKLKMPHQLSGGEQQRVVIARALLNQPVLIIADEPTGNLDPETSEEILALIRDLAIKENTAVIVATHDYRV
ncbi:MAG: ATP-binding cassette domain-containing protein, partial [Bacteroidota bacterium]